MLGLREVFYAGSIFLEIIQIAILVYCVLSWFQPRFKAFFLLRQFILPFVSPFQKLSMRVTRFFGAPVDFTCLFALIAYQLLTRAWWWLYALLVRVLR